MLERSQQVSQCKSTFAGAQEQRLNSLKNPGAVIWGIGGGVGGCCGTFVIAWRRRLLMQMLMQMLSRQTGIYSRSVRTRVEFPLYLLVPL